MITSIIDTITLIGKGIFLTMMFGAIVLFSAAAVFPERFKVEESTNTEQSIYDLIREIAPKYNVPIPLAEAIVKQESAGKRNAIRFEQNQMKRAAKYSKNHEQQKMIASSHSYFQVLGWHAIERQLSWVDLYDPRINTEVAMAILKDCLDRHKGKSRSKQIKKALECYNGSSRYANEVFDELANSLIERGL